MKKIPLIVERTGNHFVGRTEFENNLIFADEKSLDKLENKMKQLLKSFHGIEPGDIGFRHSYDLSALFEKFNYLKISTIAEIAGVNASLLRQYVIGNKQASAQQAKKIQSAIHKIGKELQSTQIYTTKERK